MVGKTLIRDPHVGTIDGGGTGDRCRAAAGRIGRTVAIQRLRAGVASDTNPITPQESSRDRP